jgi:RNA polymerase sigma-70 factor (ECF subfamily)
LVPELVARASAGDHEAFASLASAYVDRCYATAYRILRDPYQAQDATQQALIGAWRDLPSLRHPERFEAWLHRLVVNACYVELRGQRRHQARVRVLTATTEAGSDPAARVADRDALEHAFLALTVEQRAVVVSHHYLGYPLTEIAISAKKALESMLGIDHLPPEDPEREGLDREELR